MRPEISHSLGVEVVFGRILCISLLTTKFFFLLEQRHIYLTICSTKNEKKMATLAGDTTPPIFDVNFAMVGSCFSSITL